MKICIDFNFITFFLVFRCFSLYTGSLIKSSINGVTEFIPDFMIFFQQFLIFYQKTCINPIQDELFGGLLTDEEGGKKAPPP